MDKKIDKKQLLRERRRRLIKYGVAGCGIVAASVILYAYLGKTVDSRDLLFAVADEGPLEAAVVASGKVIPEYEEIINSPVATRILDVYAQAGDTVYEGMPLLQLDLESAETAYGKMMDEQKIKQHDLTQLRLENRTRLSEMAMQIEVKEMELNRLTIEVDNERRLDSIGSGTGDRIRQAETAYETCRLQLRQLREQLENERLCMESAEISQELILSSFNKDVVLQRRTLAQSRIPAPHKGVLTFISNEIGAQVEAGEKVAVVADLTSFKIEGEIPEGSSDKLSIGAEVTARISGTELKGIVSNINPQAKAGVVTFTAQLYESRNSYLTAGKRTELAVTYGYKDNVVRIHKGVYFNGPGEYAMYVMDGGNTIKKRKVTLGDSNHTYVEVISGISRGEKVVVSDTEKFKKYNEIKIKDNGNN